MLFTQMFREVPFNKDPSNQPEVRTYHQMLKMFNMILTTAPEFNKTGQVGLPINAILDWSMGTRSGFAAFLNKKVNKHLKAILNEWARFLRSPDSRYVLNEDPTKGWLGKDALEEMLNFEQEYKCDPSQPYWGFKSWDDFFTREYRDGVRPIESPDDDSVIVNVCESAPFKLSHKVKRHDDFWIKGQRYSVAHMLANDVFTDKFVGGTIYQAYLSPTTYHRWHSPVDGTIVKAYVHDGTYYAEAPVEGFDPEGPNRSQGYISEIATRGIIFIEADNPGIGLICIIQVGMGDVSSNDITVYPGQKVKKGDQIGMFHYGGSTYCLMFGPEVELDFDLRGQTPGLHTDNIPINSKIATVRNLKETKQQKKK